MDGPKIKIIITDEKAAYAKAEYFCAYQERSQQEVRDKLYEFGVPAKVVERTISELIANNFLNEERFANAYALGKFNQKGWGKVKIKQCLKIKRVPDVLIKKALTCIPDDDYMKMLEKVLYKKAAVLTERNIFKRNYKLQQYAMGRGFESDFILRILKNLN